MSTGSGSDIEDTQVPWKQIHKKALENNERSYIDPATGYTAFTELSHLDRGYCCGNTCRHCPYGYENVGKPEQLKEQAREARRRAQELKRSKQGSGSPKGEDE
ncbi:hypothetical protein GGI07_002252 [Coemansia sp. Benny D115]|nr:hypothetical protein GGI07_002252 [Coemansia sp. Benny D115]